MFDLQVSPWELLARAALIYFALLVMVRLSGKRTVGQFTPFDLLVVMLLSEAVSNGLSGGEESVTGAWIVAAALIVMNGLMGFFGSRSRRIERLLEGSPVLIGRDGQWFHDVIRRHRLGELDVEKALREADCSLSDVKIAILESDGSISIVQKK
ncbi:hypothetical protein CS062_18755 [Roseateles chitinivorans]|uniref:YetF C-terminal domain-containing protein n=1 Tax=Roseateles chitinivorans TaxID=2917965 RepID=A0A2G9C5F1_9BURK|nr:YetF domain-containing protein [Roseateles chitinivorans]PIM51653.1 hypothetical protein CS062_18755 [Roseateles chitinivorans]